MAKHRFGGAPIDFEKGEALNMRLQNLFQYPIDPFEGQVIYRTDLKIGAFYTGTAWLIFGLTETILEALQAANSPDGANPFATIDDIPIVPEDFIDLLDVPNAYTGAGGKFVAVKMTEDGLEFVELPTGGIVDIFAGVGISIDKTDPANPIINNTGGGGGSGAYLTDLDTFPVLKFDKNYRYVHEMAGALTISSELLAPAAVVGNFCKLYIKADGVNIPDFTEEFETVWDSWANSAGSWNRILAEYAPEGKIVLQIEQAHLGTPNTGAGATTITVTFEANHIITHEVTGTVELALDNTDAEIGFRTLLYIKADGVNKPFWNSDFVVTYDNYVNEAGVWNRIWLEYRPENKVLTNIINI